MTHSQGQKVKVKVTRSCNVVAPKHRIYPVNVTRQWKCICLIGNRGRRSEWRAQIFDRKFLNSCFCACAVKICQNLAYGVVKSPQFQSFYKKSWSLNTMVGAVFRPEAELTLFLRMRTKESSKHSENVFRQKSYSPVTGNGGHRSERRVQIFDRKLVNRRFCACAVKNWPKTRLLCCQIAKKFQPLYGQSQSLNTTVFKPDKNLILSADCNKTANINVKNLTV